jgi:3-oxoacyl-[acyl-carrier protein] reductase
MKTALITGGTKGIGKSVAKRLLRENWNVILTYVSDKETADLLKKDLLAAYPFVAIHVLQLDCGDLKSVSIVEEYLIKNKICLDVVLFNAGATDRNAFGSITLENWQYVFNVNINFPVFLLQQILAKLNKGAVVLFTGSLMGIHPHSLSLSYGVSKSAVHSLVKNLVKILAPKNIRINGVAPGFVDTEWQKDKPTEQKISINDKIALQRFCDPSEIADAYWFLIENEYVNGEILTIDGGYSMS